MAVDTRNKRASVLGLALASALVLPAPDSSVGAEDRQHLAGAYSGLSAAGRTGTVAVTSAAPTVTASGKVYVAGTGAVTSVAPTASASGAVLVSGTAAVTLAAPTASASGKVYVTGTAAVTLAAPTVAGTGKVGTNVVGTGAVTSAAPTVSASGTVLVRGTAAVTSAAPTASASGTVRVAGAGAVTSAAPTVAATGAVLVRGTAAVTLVAPTAAGTGTVASLGPITGTAAVTLPAPTVYGYSTVVLAERAPMGYDLSKNFRKAIQLGRAFSITGQATLNTSATYIYHLKTPDDKATNGLVYLVFKVRGSGEYNVKLYEAPTLSSNGTVVTQVSRRRYDPKASLVSAYHTPTVSGLGTLIAEYHAGAGVFGGGDIGDDLWILGVNTSYLLRIESEAATNDVSWDIEWMERQ